MEDEDCPDIYVRGKFLIPKAQLIDEELWETRRFHRWYMEAAKAGMSGFTIKIPPKYFHLNETITLPVDFRNMWHLFREEDLDIVQVALFTL